MIYIDTRQADAEVKRLESILSTDQIRKGIAMAMNETMALERTVFRKKVTSGYNIPFAMAKGVEYKRAFSSKLYAEMGAPGKPLSLSYFKPKFVNAGYSATLRYSKKNGLTKKIAKGKKNTVGGVSIEVIKGQPKNIPFAFMLSNSSKVVFARGAYGKGKSSGFIERHHRVNKSGNDTPISKMISVSVYSAAFGLDKLDKVPNELMPLYTQKLARILNSISEGAIKS